MRIEKIKKRFVEEFVLNLKNQKYKLLMKYEKVFGEIWLDYLYSVCPPMAIYIDPKIIDLTRIKQEV